MAEQLTFGSLFAGIGGFDLGFERAGMRCEWQVEIDPFCTKVLAKHWPNVRRWDDVRTFPPGDPGEWRVDVICGGFPCQDITSSGKRAGIHGEKSSLFFEVVRVVRLVRPRVLVLENVSDLLSRGMGTVLGELAAIGYDAQWECVPAAAFGVPQRRWRTFIVSHPSGSGLTAKREWLEGRQKCGLGSHHDGLDAAEHKFEEMSRLAGREDDGVSDWMDRVRVLGNAVVPQVAEWIGMRLTDIS